MKKSLKGALLSGLVFPGAGQLWLKQPIRGIALMVAVSAALLVVATEAARQALSMLEKIESEGGALDLFAVATAASQASGIVAGNALVKSAWLALIFSWIISTVDAYFTGRRLDLADTGGAPEVPGS